MGAGGIFQCHDVRTGFALGPILSEFQRVADPAGMVARPGAVVLFAGTSFMARIGPHVRAHCRRKPCAAVDRGFVALALLALAAAVFSGRNHFVLGQPTWKEDASFIYDWIIDRVKNKIAKEEELLAGN